jgi:glycosyltransferase involved in cell wall biosynthesis
MLDYELPRLELKNIIFTGQVSNPADYLNQISVFALTSREDPFPLVALEAAALSKPIICFNESGGMVEFVNNGAGIVVPYIDVKQMGDSIIQILESTELRNRFGHRAKELAYEYEGEKPAKHIWNIINQIISNNI